MIDLIGDIHGHADKLEELLIKLGYSNKSGLYAHPNRKALFVGDFIDRGPKIRETLAIVKAMVESGNAIALMGNHEYNALCFHFQETERPIYSFYYLSISLLLLRFNNLKSVT